MTSLIKDLVDKEIADLVYPKRLVMPIPMVNESYKLDKEGKIIPKWKVAVRALVFRILTDKLFHKEKFEC